MTLAEVVLVVVVAAVSGIVGLVVGRRSRPVPAGEPAVATLPSAATGPRSSAVDNLPGALWHLPLGIVVAEADGTVVYRNALAEGLVVARHGEALVEAAVQELIGVPGGRDERVLDLYGPPRRRLVVKSAPIQVDGETAGTLVMIEDVTEQQRVDTLRRDFVANVSHELKTPVGAIGVLAEALQGEDDPDVASRLASRLQAEALRLGHTVDDLLALSRIESGELFDPVEVDLDDVVAAALERCASPAERRGIAVTARRAEHPVVVLADRRQLVSAVGNLVDNAIKYSDTGSQVVVTVATSGSEATVSVADQGIGIPSSDLERIFERFYRVDPARSRGTGGTGLGLSIVRHVALNHGGDVAVRSTEGSGSTFTLRLPLTVTAPAAPTAPADAAPDPLVEAGAPSRRPDPLTEE